MSRRLVVAVVAVGTVLLLAGDGASIAAGAGDPERWLDDVTDRFQIDLRHVRAMTPRYWFPEIMSGGAAWLDYDGDGDPDLYLVQGGALDPSDEDPPANRLLRNDGGRFVDVTAASGARDHGYGMGAATSDFDGDGDVDLYVTNVGANRLFRNDGDGTFTEMGAAAGVADTGWGTSAAFADIDGDGDPDLYVVNYVSWSPAGEIRCFGTGGRRDYCHPSRYDSPAPDRLFRNDGDGVFSDISQSAGIGRAFGNGLGVTATDFDADGRMDFYVANDGMPNQLWLQQPDGSFRDDGLVSGCALSGSGQPEAGMGIAVADLEGDSDPDLFVTHLRQETNTLYLNHSGSCEDATAAWRLAAPSLGHTGFGTVFGDFDADGTVDLYVANGRVGASGDPERPFAEPNQLFQGLADRFREVPEVPALIENSRAVAMADFDLDGAPDLAIVNNGGRLRLLRNVAGRDRRWLAVQTDAGVVETWLTVGNRTVLGTTHLPSSYCAAHEPRSHFGLGRARADRLRLRWSGGRTLELRSPPTGRNLRWAGPAALPAGG